MKTYNPHEYQMEFHKSDARFRTMIAGRRGGKSLAGTIEALLHADKNPGCKGWVVSPTYVMLRDVNMPMMLDFLPEHSVKEYNRTEKRIELVNGSEVVFRSAEDPNKLRGVGLDWLWLDEACFMKREVWDVLYPTLTDTGGVAWVTTTPQGYDWVYDEFYKPAVEGNKDYECWRFKTLDNPHIDPELVEKARKERSDQMFRQEYEATFEKFTGLVYPDFDERKHVIPTKEFDPDDLYFVGIDVGYTNPSAALLIAEDADKNMYVIDEVYESGLTVPEVAKKIKNMVGDLKIEAYIIDASAKGTSQAAAQFTDMSVMDQFVQEDIPVEAANRDIIAGLNRMTQLIKGDKVKVFSRCEHFLREIANYSWPKNRGDDSNKDERPMKAWDHAMDAVRYVMMSRPEDFERQKRDWYGRKVQEADDLDYVGEDNTVVDLM